ncbi:MAG: Flp pilus assembly complex ATPase component TadA [Deltaproteobacteria bacterium]|nr:Flp pilus assembly complex ATPase component TadA [Deltaproteobacteria bacterium]
MKASTNCQDFLKHLGEEMVQSGLITSDQLAVARVTQDSMGGNIGNILLKKGFVGEDQITNFLSGRLNIPLQSIKGLSIDTNLVRLIPYTLAYRYSMLPLAKRENKIQLALADPLSLYSLDEISNTLHCELEVVLAPKEEVLNAMREHYRKQDLREIDIDEVEVIKETDENQDENTEKVQEMASSVGAVSAVNSIFLQAYREKASDIHVEPQRDYVRVRLRVDGRLEERQILPRRMLLPVTSRIKILSGMNIAERRAPQDGRAQLKISGNFIDMRTSSYPTAFGEKIVIRLLRKDNLMKLEHLGFSSRDLKVFSQVITQPFGIILVTGPTGSGKSTTLYAALQRVNSIDRNIVSVEDPIESEIGGVNQAQVNPKAGMTFASALRSILRQDPDVIMIGEIRDGETADMALRAAMTGHLVFSTLHTNTAVGAIPRLINLGVAPFLLSSSLLGVMAQRLIRRICQDCRTPTPADPQMLRYLGMPEDAVVYKGAGCPKCRNTGFAGRIGLFEIVPVKDKMKTIIEQNAKEEEIMAYIKSTGEYRSMKEDGIEKILQGVVTLEEVIKVTEAE